MSAHDAAHDSGRELPKAYEPAEVEDRLYQWWETSGFFHADPGGHGEPFSIVIPPPNVTGSLHIGHALDNALQDAVVRRARMRARNAVWIPGTDHAGIATQNVVEKQLAAQGLTRHDLGREAFVERVWQWREESGGTILTQLRRLGASCDWDREAFTFDEQRSKAVRKVFVDLYEQGLIYRGNRLINWCPRCVSAISDIEVDHSEEEGELAFLRYPGSDGSDGVVVATTRAETMLGDTGIAVHPDDERYAHLVGKTVRLPLMDRDIPVFADSHVDPEFGTGAVKVTPAHDPNDHEMGQRHGLPAIDVMTDEAAINANGGAYEGLDRFEARRKVKEDLDALGLLVKVEAHTHSVGHCSRCGTIVEPRLSDQWFVKVRPLAEQAAKAVRDGRTAFVPERNAKPFLDWLDNLNDWCISRQIWWGHRIPAWYDADGGVHVLREDPTPEEAEARGLTRDPDVLDTWFSSALWPFTTLGWPDDTPELRAWYPTTVLVTGYDINTFWVSRMMLMALRFMDDVPFHTVLNHGLVRDRFGKKMSKSFGNVIDPLELIDRFGADALRFALFRAAAPGQDVPLAEEWVEGARRFANKLWNAARFVLLQLGDVTPADGLPDTGALEVEDRWILSRLEACRAEVEAAWEDYDVAAASRALYHFVWDEYCDWYLELAKLRDDRAGKLVLAHVLDVALRLLHPLMPFITEEIWRTLRRTEDTIMRAEWPPATSVRDADAEAAVEAVQEAVTELRRFRAEHNLAPATRIDVVARASAARRAPLQAGVDGIRRLAGVARWSWADEAGEPAGGVGTVVLTDAELAVPLEGLIDLGEERERLERELAKAEAEVKRAQGKLANEAFTAKAPPQVVEAERAKAAEWADTAATLRAQLDSLS
ncbi:MAG TPA: valine--tRNA ligase [Egibacteraceae bacterium]|nr:valine--tRNA ligase [Egibacteraceae bacterium]